MWFIFKKYMFNVKNWLKSVLSGLNVDNKETSAQYTEVVLLSRLAFSVG